MVPLILDANGDVQGVRADTIKGLTIVSATKGTNVFETVYAYVSPKYAMLDPIFLDVLHIQAIPADCTTQIVAGVREIRCWTGCEVKGKIHSPVVKTRAPVVPVVSAYKLHNPVWNFST